MRPHCTRPLIVEALRLSGGATQVELQAMTGLSGATVCRHLKTLRDRREAHIADWRKPAKVNGCAPWAALYRLGACSDKPRPKPLTQAQRWRQARVEMQKTGDWEDRLARQRARYWKAKPAARDPLVAAMFGPAS